MSGVAPVTTVSGNPYPIFGSVISGNASRMRPCIAIGANPEDTNKARSHTRRISQYHRPKIGYELSKTTQKAHSMTLETFDGLGGVLTVASKVGVNASLLESSTIANYVKAKSNRESIASQNPGKPIPEGGISEVMRLVQDLNEKLLSQENTLRADMVSLKADTVSREDALNAKIDSLTKRVDVLK
ncbi:uncharacterized protein DFL_005764 [Arthrobotrys flagrans]|uniref:Uncharacterized protein n=1 Tax=Arthrobotrys flagrans TaxID=97331 RepID=A0A436ZYB5_ARTFL|nr:hypothetical protein DFL_005764 [Arthrobotrys flagrans]